MKHLFLLLRNLVVLFNQTLVDSKQHKSTSNGIYESGWARLLCRRAYVLFVLSYVLTFLVHCCDVRYDFIKTMFGSSLPPVVCRGGGGGLMSYLYYLCFSVYTGFQHVLTIWVTWWASYKRQKLLTLRDHMGSPPVLGGVRVAHLFGFLCWVLFWLSSSCAMLPVCLDCQFLIAPLVFSNVHVIV